jgi:hypothetical protein
MSDIMQALVRMLTREMNGGNDRGGDILERAIGAKKLGSGNSGKLSTSNTTTQANPNFPTVGGILAPIIGLNGEINQNFSVYDTIQSNTLSAIPFVIEKLPPDVYTVHLSTQGQPPYNGGVHGVILDAEATIVFSVDGRQATRRVSINQGVRICGQADSINVSVQDRTQLASDNAINTVQYQIIIGVSRGVRPDQQQPPTLAPVDANGYALNAAALLIAPAGDVVIPVPQDVGVISTNTLVWDVAGPGGAITEGEVSVTYLNNADAICTFDPRVAPWIPIRPGTNAVRLNNNWSANVQFSLMFGIDG